MDATVAFYSYHTPDMNSISHATPTTLQLFFHPHMTSTTSQAVQQNLLARQNVFSFDRQLSE